MPHKRQAPGRDIHKHFILAPARSHTKPSSNPQSALAPSPLQDRAKQAMRRRGDGKAVMPSNLPTILPRFFLMDPPLGPADSKPPAPTKPCGLCSMDLPRGAYSSSQWRHPTFLKCRRCLDKRRRPLTAAPIDPHGDRDDARPTAGAAEGAMAPSRPPPFPFEGVGSSRDARRPFGASVRPQVRVVMVRVGRRPAPASQKLERIIKHHI